MKPSPEEIAQYAYFIWQKEGCCNGRDVEHWTQAEAHLKAIIQHEGQPSKPSSNNSSGTQEKTRKAPLKK